MSNFYFINFILSSTLFEVVKTFLIVGLVLYTAFAAIIVRQVGVMSESIEDSFNGAVILFAWLHLGLSIFLVITSITLL